MIIAMDGPSGSGKGTLSKILADHYNLAFLDTGLLYRAVAERALDLGVSHNEADRLSDLAKSLDMNHVSVDELRRDEVAVMASKVAALPGVRQALLDFQKNFAAHPPEDKNGAILDGRDIGTTVCPNADYKIFLTSALEVRAARRHKELQNRGIESIYSEVLADMLARDKRDSQRQDSPLRPALDAYVVDTSEKSVDEVAQQLIHLIDHKMNNN